jgi:hypothetical protein
LSEFFGSSRAKPRDGPDQPPCIKAIRMAESILFCSRYAFRFLIASAVTFNMVVNLLDKIENKLKYVKMTNCEFKVKLI